MIQDIKQLFIGSFMIVCPLLKWVFKLTRWFSMTFYRGLRAK